jgi:hypothetical protein
MSLKNIGSNRPTTKQKPAGGDMEITEKFLRIDNHACDRGYQWWLENDKPTDVIATAKRLNSDDHNDWANWLIVRFMTHEQKVQYAIFAAEQVIDIYEKKYPDDDRPRKAIEAAKNYLKDKSLENKNAAYAAAYDAAYAAYAAADAYAYAAADDAADAAYVAAAAADAAYAAAAAAASYAYAAAAAAAYAADATADAADAAYVAAYAAAYAAYAATDAAYTAAADAADAAAYAAYTAAASYAYAAYAAAAAAPINLIEIIKRSIKEEVAL